VRVLRDADGVENNEENLSDDDDDNRSTSSSSSSSTETSQIMLNQLRSNDPELTTLCMDSIAIATIGSEWMEVGQDIGRNTHLELISFHHVHNMSREDYAAVFHGMGQNRSIRDLDFLRSDMLEGRFFSLLIPIFERICQLTIEDCFLGLEGSILLSNALGGCSGSFMEEVNLDRIGSGETGIVRIIQALRVHSNLEKISCRGNEIGTCGCKELLDLLPNQKNDHQLITLDLGENFVGGDGASLLASGLNNESSTTTHLNLDGTHIDMKGFEAFANLLRSPFSRLKSLSLNDTFINEEELVVLANSLIHNSMLTDLHLNNTDITYRGLQVFSLVLSCDTSGLNLLSLRNNRIKNKGAILLANSLIGNRTLSRLDLANDVSITSKGWKAFSKILGGNRRTIMVTYRCNHTLQTLLGDEWTLSGDLMLLLLMNREGNKSHVARQKIIKYHLHGSFDMQPFVDMDLRTMPHVIAWMGRDGISLLYHFIRNMQSNLKFNPGAKDDCPMTKRVKIHTRSDGRGPEGYIGDWWHDKLSFE